MSVDSVNPNRLVRALLDWYGRQARDLPWRRTRDPYAIWVSEIMLQQTQVKTVLPYWERWMRALPTVRDLARAPLSRVLKLWEGLGYYSRARNLHRAAQMVMDRHGGQVPTKYDDLLALPGIGRYTVGAIGSIAFNQPWPLVDGNVLRLLTRIFGIRKDPREKTTQEQLWTLAEELVRIAARVGKSSATPCSHFNQSLMELGALVCTPRQPKCPECPLFHDCQARRLNLVASLPIRSHRPAVLWEERVAFVVRQRGRYWICQRPASGRNASLWEFPNAKLNHPRDGQASAATGRPMTPTLPRKGQVRLSARRLFKHIPDSLTCLGTIRYTFTHHRIRLHVYQAELKKIDLSITAHARWATQKTLGDLPFTAAHRKIVNQYLPSL